MPPTPNDFKNLIPSPSGNLCEKVSKLLVDLPQKFYEFISWMMTESGTPTEEFSQWVCDNECGSGGTNTTPNANMPAPTGVSASDGTYSDRVLVSWNAVTPPAGIGAVTAYKVYRALSTETNPSNATLLATVDAPTVQYEDTSAVQGTTYNYWVVATNGTQTSNFGGPDVGNAGAPTSDLDAISDLMATQGHYFSNDGFVALVFTPPTGATKFDIYRNTTNDFSTATKIGSDKTATDSASHYTYTTGTLWDNLDKFVYLDTPPSGTTVYYYWVVGKKDAPPAVSDESNVATGWINVATGLTGPVLSGPLTGTITIPAGVTKMRVRFFGQGGDGAGGGYVYGGGGGGAGGAIYADIDVAEGDEVALGGSGGSHANTANQTSGNNGGYITLLLNSVEILRANGGAGGVYSSSGGGAGGAGGTTSGSVTFTGFSGSDGEAGAGTHGGRGGARFGQIRQPAAHFDVISDSGWDGNGASGNGGGGSFASPIDVNIADAGQGGGGGGVFCYSVA